MRAVLVYEPGGPDALTLTDIPVPQPGPGEAVVKVAASGVNFIDVYYRTGVYKAAPPIAIGSEAAGTVYAVGEGVTGVAPGDRVAFAMSRGTYAEYARVPAASLVPVPQTLTLETAAAVLLQGMTAHYLTHSTCPLLPGDTCLVHAAAGGTGALVVQMAKARGARVFGTVSTPAKAAVAREAGADEVINYLDQDFVSEVRRLTGGRGVRVVYDGVGRDTFDRSLDSLAPRGMMVLFGASSGAVPPMDPALLNGKGSLFLTRPSLAHHTASPDETQWRARELFEMLANGSVRVRIDRIYPLAEAAEAHRALEGRSTTGKLLLAL